MSSAPPALLDEPSFALTAPAGERWHEAGEKPPVGWLQRWVGHLAAHDRHLVAQDDDLDGERILVTAGNPDQLVTP
jgi:hypothetical protein